MRFFFIGWRLNPHPIPAPRRCAWYVALDSPQMLGTDRIWDGQSALPRHELKNQYLKINDSLSIIRQNANRLTVLLKCQSVLGCTRSICIAFEALASLFVPCPGCSLTVLISRLLFSQIKPAIESWCCDVTMLFVGNDPN